jgi:tetratricopeptide (TPR) repeat protein
MGNLIWEMKLPGEEALVDKLYAESLARFHQMGDRLGVASVLGSMGELARGVRDYPRAIDAFERSLVLMRELRDTQSVAHMETNLAYVLYYAGDHERAKALLIESLHLFQEVASAYSAAWALFAWAGIERAQGDPRKAATLIGAANALAAPAGTLFDPNDQRDREEIEAAVRADLSDAKWQSAQEEGRTMHLDEAVDYALGNGSIRTRDAQSPL